VVPLLGQTSLWAILLLIATIAARAILAWRHRSAPHMLVKLGVLAVGVGGVLAEFGSITGVEAGMAVLIALIAVKVLEANSFRDLQVLALLGYFLLLCALFFGQDLARWLYVGFVLLLLTAGMVLASADEQPRAIRSATVMAVRLLLQALPLLLLFFFFFPRIYGGFRFQFNRSTQAGTGMADEMRPGSLAALALRQDVAFYAEFPDGNSPSQADLYWRGLVLWRGDGLTWMRSQLSPYRSGKKLQGEAIRQKIVVQPHGGRWLFALDRPFAVISKASLEPGDFLQSDRPVFYPMTYEVTSRPENHEKTLPRDQLTEATRKPQHLSAAVVALVNSWRESAKSDQDVVDAALKYFQANNFAYSLTPGGYGENALDEFLFQRRNGFCEHYAGAFASLMRVAGIPSRVVVGYHGGQFNRHGNYVIVRQSDAHAWCEVWMAGVGWQRVDPTNVIAPERINSGLDDYIQSQANQGEGAGGQVRRNAGWRNAVRDLRLMWDGIAYKWDLWVLNFDEDNQRSMLLTLGLGAWDWSAIVGLLVAGILVVLALVGAWLWFSAREPADPALHWYRRLCRRLARLGAERQPWEGPVQFANRAAAGLPSHAQALQEAVSCYVKLRYSKEPPPIGDFVEKVRELERMK
jgi:transglutaminase-like putative cysteine protease